MVIRHTDLPNHYGERQFAERLMALGPEDAHVWFEPVLPNVPRLDVIYYDPAAGFFVIEVKAFGLANIEEYTAGRMVCRDRYGTKSPVAQAADGRDKLLSYFHRRAKLDDVPFVTSTVAFPEIAEDGFAEAWGSSMPVRMQIPGLIFADALAAADLLLSKLKNVVDDPPLGAAPKYAPELPFPALDDVIGALDQGHRVPQDLSELDHIKRIKEGADRAKGRDEEGQAHDGLQPDGTQGPTAPRRRLAAWEKYLVPDPGRRVRLAGPPGTGKTDRLLQFGLAHAKAGRAVLFACYNKVLRSEVARLLTAMDEEHESVSDIDVIHVDALDWMVRNGTWARDQYQTILIDEAQDLATDRFELLQSLAADGAEWFAADGPGQELYKKDTTWLEGFRRESETLRLQFRYRNAGALGLLSGAIRDIGPELGKLPDWLSNRDSDFLEQLEMPQLALDIEVDSMPGLPEIRRIDSLANSRDGRRDFVKELIADELEKVAKHGDGGSLVVMVASTGPTAEAAWARDALNDLEVSFADLTPKKKNAEEDARLDIVPAGMTRLVSMHSARGIEASHTLLLGLERLGGVSFGGDEQQQRALAYIASSRAKTAMTIGCIPSGDHPIGARYVAFVERFIQELRGLQDA